MKKLKSILKAIFTAPEKDERSSNVRREYTEKVMEQVREKKRVKNLGPEKEETVIF